MPNERVDLSDAGLEKLQVLCDAVEPGHISRLREFLSRRAVAMSEVPKFIECAGECLIHYDYARQALPAALKELKDARARIRELMLALESLTPSGSEFAGDAEACVRYAKERAARAIRRMELKHRRPNRRHP